MERSGGRAGYRATTCCTVASNIERWFHLSDRGATIRKEVRPTTRSFLNMTYVLAVNPRLSVSGVKSNDTIFGTAISSAVGRLVVGICTKLPFRLAPSIGISTYVSFGLVQIEFLTLIEEAMTAFLLVVFEMAVTSVVRHLTTQLTPFSYQKAIRAVLGVFVGTIRTWCSPRAWTGPPPIVRKYEQ